MMTWINGGPKRPGSAPGYRPGSRAGESPRMVARVLRNGRYHFVGGDGGPGGPGARGSPLTDVRPGSAAFGAKTCGIPKPSGRAPVVGGPGRGGPAQRDTRSAGLVKDEHGFFRPPMRQAPCRLDLQRDRRDSLFNGFQDNTFGPSHFSQVPRFLKNRRGRSEPDVPEPGTFGFLEKPPPYYWPTSACPIPTPPPPARFEVMPPWSTDQFP